MSVELSVVTTMYMSAPYLREFHARVTRAAASISSSFEVIYVNDGSRDDSLEVAREIQRGDVPVRIVDLSRNFGHHRAIMTGLAHARGRQVFLIDCDLEEPPEELPRFHEVLQRERADAVFGVQVKRKGGLMERVSGALFYRLFNLLSSHAVTENQVIARLMTRRYVDALVMHRDREIFLAGLAAITGFKQVAVPVEKHSKGSTTYTFSKRVAALVNALTSFSSKPLVYIFYLGLVISVVAAAAAAYLIIRRVFFGVLLSGWPSLMVSIWFFGGMTIFCIGVIGIYLSKVFSEIKDRPYTIVREVLEPDVQPLASASRPVSLEKES
ncbi:MAG: glycosyltransferase family 2 protein [Myxococcota bacterium]